MVPPTPSGAVYIPGQRKVWQPFWHTGSKSTVRVDSLPHRKWKEIKQQPSMLPGYSLVSLHFLWVILCPQAVMNQNCDSLLIGISPPLNITTCSCTLGKKGQKTWSPSFTRSIMLSAGRHCHPIQLQRRPTNRKPLWRYGFHGLSPSLLSLLMGSNWTNIHVSRVDGGRRIYWLTERKLK